jgi:hypothetical protein
MTRYCPTCKSEFRTQLSHCPDDKTQLVPKAAHEKNLVLSDIYAAANEVEAERIIAFLVPKGIAAEIFRRGIAQMPMAGDNHYLIAVDKAHIAHSKRLIENARKDHIISSDGFFLT